MSKAIQRRERRVLIHQQVWDLRQQGLSGRAIAEKIGIGHATVFRYLRHPQFIERKGRSDRGRSKLDPYKEFLLKQWNHRCYDTTELFFNLKKQGYSGSYDTVARYTRRLRQATGVELGQRIITQALPQVVEPLRCALTPRKAAGLVMQKFERLKANDQQLISLLKNRSPELSEAIELAQDFTDIVRQRTPQNLEAWLERAISSKISPIRRFALRLREDYDSVKAGVTFSVSNGPVEGHVNRLKMLKRQMYGRAGIDLLSRRFLIKM
ncbi:transposase [Leptolyngbya sp. ST-U4]|uniref:transposase n=1 Tax=Leptolyngbya sp. ST-U4 TaxID=2933912 RepID=UPI003296A00D